MRKFTDQDAVGLSELHDLLSAIEAAEKDVMAKVEALIALQHRYLEVVGFKIEPMQGGSVNDYVYRRGDETFVDVDHAMEYAEE